MVSGAIAVVAKMRMNRRRKKKRNHFRNKLR
jgi:hypothetical protein